MSAPIDYVERLKEYSYSDTVCDLITHLTALREAVKGCRGRAGAFKKCGDKIVHYNGMTMLIFCASCGAKHTQAIAALTHTETTNE